MNSFLPLFYFSSPASQWMVSLVNLYDSVSFYIVIILTFTLWFLIFTYFTPSRYDRLGGSLGTTGLKHGRTLSHWVEFFWTVSPALVLWLIGIPSLKLLYLMDEILDPRLSVKVKGSQWFWSYEYGDSNIGFDSFIQSTSTTPTGNSVELFRQYMVDNFLVLPVHSPVRLLVTSNDVIHSFALPSLAIKVDAIPGRLNMAGLVIHSTGVYFGQCSELCGVLHGFMPIAVQAVTIPTYLSTIYP